MKNIFSLLLLILMLLSVFEASAFAGDSETFDADKLNCYTDLHLHLDGSISLNSARELASLQDIDLPEDDASVIEMLCADEDCADLNEFLGKFELPTQLLQTKEACRWQRKIFWKN